MLGDSENRFSIFFRRFKKKVVPHLPAEREMLCEMVKLSILVLAPTVSGYHAVPLRFLGQKNQSVNRDFRRRATRVRVTVTYITIDHALSQFFVYR